MLKYLAPFLFLTTTCILAQSPESIQSRFAKKYLNFEDVKCEFSVEETSEVFPVKSGKIYFKSNGKFKFEGENFDISSDGESIWNYNKKSNKLIIAGIDESFSKSINLESIFSAFKNGKVILNKIENSDYVFQLFPEENSQEEFVEIRTDNKYQIITITPYFKNIKPIRIKILNIELNNNFNELDFKLITPDNVKIVDIR